MLSDYRVEARERGRKWTLTDKAEVAKSKLISRYNPNNGSGRWELTIEEDIGRRAMQDRPGGWWWVHWAGELRLQITELHWSTLGVHGLCRWGSLESRHMRDRP